MPTVKRKLSRKKKPAGKPITPLKTAAKTTKNPGGRPTDYDPDYARQAEVLCERGMTDEDLAEVFNVTRRTVANWKLRHPEFGEACKLGKDAFDDRVELALAERAIGYTYDSEKVLVVNGVIERVPIKEHVPPDTAAIRYWLNNRRSDQWKDRQALEHTGKDGGPIETKELSDMEVARRIAFTLARGTAQLVEHDDVAS